MVYDVFICYETTTGKGVAKNLHKALTKGKYNTFYDRKSLLDDEDWEEKIDSAIEEASFFVVIFTAGTIDSPEVKRECNKALELNKSIITCRSSDIPISDTKEFPKSGVHLSKLNQIEFEEKYELAHKVRIAIRRILDKRKKKVEIKEDSEEFIQRGNLFSNLMEFDKALHEYNKAIDIDSQNASAYVNKGYSLNKMGQAFNEKGESENAKKCFEKAVKSFDKAIRIDPENASTYEIRGYSLNEIGLYFKIKKRDDEKANECFEEAVKSFNKAIIFDPKNESTYDIRGFSLHELGRYEEAIESFNNAVGINPKLWSAYANRGFSLNEMGKSLRDKPQEAKNCFEKAIDSFDKAIKIDPENWVVYSNKGYSLEMLGKHDEAKKCRKKGNKLKPA